MAETLDTFFAALCRRMGWEPSTWRINALKTMAQMEGYPTTIRLEQTWNPLDTMHPTGAVGNWNAAGVKIYPNLEAGVEATARTLEQPNFSNLKETLETEQVNEGTAADLQLWGWNSPNLLNTILNAMGGEAMPRLPGRETVGPDSALASRAKPVTGQAGDPSDPNSWSPQNIIRIVSQLGAQVAANPEDFALAMRMDQAISVLQNYRQAGLLETEEGIPSWEREATEAQTAVNWANANSIIAWDEGKTYEQGRQRILDQWEEKRWTAEQGVREFNAWMEGAIEARTRAESVYGEEMKRKVWTTPEEYYPGTGPGGATAQLYAEYDMPYTPSKGVPVSQLPNLDEMYGQWHGRMGISEQAPPLPRAGAPMGGMQGGGAPMGGQGAAAAQAFLEQLMQRRSSQFGAGRA